MNYKDFDSFVDCNVYLNKGSIPCYLYGAAEEAVRYGIEHKKLYVRINELDNVAMISCGNVPAKISKAMSDYLKVDGIVSYGSPKNAAVIIDVKESVVEMSTDRLDGIFDKYHEKYEYIHD